MATNVIENGQALVASADEVFAADRIQAIVAVRTAGGTLGYGHTDFELAQTVIDTANARGFVCSLMEPMGEFVLLLFDPDSTGVSADDSGTTES